MMAQSNAERYNVVVRIRIGFQIIELPTAQSLRPSVRTGAPPFTQGRHEALPRQCVKLQFGGENIVKGAAVLPGVIKTTGPFPKWRGPVV